MGQFFHSYTPEPGKKDTMIPKETAREMLKSCSKEQHKLLQMLIARELGKKAAESIKKLDSDPIVESLASNVHAGFMMKVIVDRLKKIDPEFNADVLTEEMSLLALGAATEFGVNAEDLMKELENGKK